MTEKTSCIANHPLEQFVLLAKAAKGVAAVELIKQALDMTGVYVFGELLDMENIKELSTGPHAAYYQLLEVFAYGTYSEYKENQANLPELSPLQLAKLRHLTIVSLATKNKQIPYSVLLKDLEVENLRKLEDIIIEVIYADIVHGKLDQKNQRLEVDYAIGRDVQKPQVTEIISVLQEWCTSCEGVLTGIDTEIKKANHSRDTGNKLKAQTDTEVANIKKTLKSSQQQDTEEQMVTDSRDVTIPQEKSSKKTLKPMKGLRGSNKLFK